MKPDRDYFTDTSISLLSQSQTVAAKKHALIKEIGRLRLQLHDAKYLDKSVERSEFLRREITFLSDQLSQVRRSH